MGLHAREFAIYGVVHTQVVFIQFFWQLDLMFACICTLQS